MNITIPPSKTLIPFPLIFLLPSSRAFPEIRQMATAEGGGGAAINVSASYGGGGAGGKFRKKPFRGQSTPYDRPPTALRGTNTNAGNSNTRSWLTKLVVDPASKLISYGADRFLASVFRKRLPPPPPPSCGQESLLKAEENNDASHGSIPNCLKIQDNTHGLTNGSFKSNVTSEFEQLLKQKTFSRAEIVHLTELLQSRAVDVSHGGEGQKNEESTLSFGRHEQIDCGPSEENKNAGIISSTVISTLLNSKVCGNDIASPPELAKTYLGSRPSKVSPSELGMCHQIRRDDAGVLSNGPLTLKSPSMSLIKKTSTSMAAPESSFKTPRSRGRSAVYNMARTPYSRVHPTSMLKGSGFNSNGNAGSSMLLGHTLVDHDEKFEHQTLKRRSAVLDDGDYGSVGPIRRIRQKSNPLAPRIHQMMPGGGIDYQEKKQTLQSIGEPGNKPSKATEGTENGSGSSTSYACIPSKSSEVAARILQNLEKLTPKEKSSESKFLSLHEKSPLKLTPDMLSGRALRSMEDVDSLTLLVDIIDDQKLGNKHKTALPAGGVSSSPKPRKVENDPEESVVPSNYCELVINEKSADSLRAFSSSAEITDTIIEYCASQPPQKQRVFWMSVQEDFLDQDDDAYYNESTSKPFSEKKGTIRAPLPDNIVAPTEVSKLIKTSIEQEVNPSSCLALSSASGLSSPGALLVGEGSSFVFPASEQATDATQPVVPLSVAAFDEPKETKAPAPLFCFNSNAADRFNTLPSDSGKMAESNLEGSSSLANLPVSAGSQAKTSESHTIDYLIPKAGDVNEKSSGLEAPLTATSAADRNLTSTNGTLQLTASSPGTSVRPTVTSSGIMFGMAAKPSNSAEPLFKFGVSVDRASAVSKSSAANISEIAVLRTKAEEDPSSGVPSSSNSSMDILAANTGSNTSKLGSLISHSNSAANNLQDSLFSSAAKSLVFGTGTVSQASSSDTPTVFSGSVPTSCALKFGENPSISEGAAVNSGTTPGAFGFNASSSSTYATGLSSSATLPKFSFGGNSAVSVSATNTASPLSSDTSVVFNVNGSSSTSSAANPANSSDAPSLSSWQNPKTSVFGSKVSSSSSSSSPTGFSFGASSASSDPSASSSSMTGFAFGASSTSSAPVPSPSSGFPLGALMPSSAPTLSPSPSTGYPFGQSSASSAPVLSSLPSTGFPAGASSASSAPAMSHSLTGFSFGASTSSFGPAQSSMPSASTNAAPVAFNSSSGTLSSPFFPFNSGPASVLSSSSLPINHQPVFGNTPAGGFTVPPGSSYNQLNAEDSMAEDPVQSSAPSVFGQPLASPPPPAFPFGSTVPSQPNPFMFGGQQNQLAPHNPSSLQGSGSLEFNAGGSFSLGSGGGDKSNRKVVRISRNKNRKR